MTLACSFDDIRRVARFVNEVPAMIDSGGDALPGWHMHFRDRDANWTKEEADLKSGLAGAGGPERSASPPIRLRSGSRKVPWTQGLHRKLHFQGDGPDVRGGVFP